MEHALWHPTIHTKVLKRQILPLYTEKNANMKTTVQVLLIMPIVSRAGAEHPDQGEPGHGGKGPITV